MVVIHTRGIFLFPYGKNIIPFHQSPGRYEYTVGINSVNGSFIEKNNHGNQEKYSSRNDNPIGCCYWSVLVVIDQTTEDDYIDEKNSLPG